MTDPDQALAAVDQRKAAYDRSAATYADDQAALIAAIVEALKAGVNVAELVRRSGWSERYVRGIKAKAGLPKGTPGAKPGHRPTPRKAR
jgi:hypothetical protein